MKDYFILVLLFKLHFLKRLAAILFLIVFSFNLFGYQLLFSIITLNAEAHMQALLDRGQYDENNLLEIRIPLSNPYITNSDGFSRVTGQVSLKGMIYQYVKRAIKDGDLVLLCLPDQERTSIDKANQDYSGFAYDFQQNDVNGNKSKAKFQLAKSLKLKYNVSRAISPENSLICYLHLQHTAVSYILPTITLPVSQPPPQIS